MFPKCADVNADPFSEFDSHAILCGMLSSTSQQVFDQIPADGRPISGAKLRERAGVGAEEFRQAKAELKGASLIHLGRGRGGTVMRVPGTEAPEVKKLSPDERMEIAREVKAEKTREQQKFETLRAAVIQIGKKRHPEAENIVPGFYDGRWYVEVWSGKKAKPDFFPQELLL